MRVVKFVDLFAGIGAFHQAISKIPEIKAECVLVSEIDKNAINTYRENYQYSDEIFDITSIDEVQVPSHDILFGGFPCQAFSNAGHKKGFLDTRGTLFFDIERILRYKKPKYILLENVKHLIKHDEGNTYRIIIEVLKDIGYILTKEPLVVSPVAFGIPQNRERVFIAGVHKTTLNSDFENIVINIPKSKKRTSIYDVLEENVFDDEYKISQYEEMVLNAWDEFMRLLDKRVLGFPIWADEFYENYDYSHYPTWKQDYIRKNRQLYNQYKVDIDKWIQKYKIYENFKLRDRKFEWQAGEEIKTVWETSIQLRQSGVRCKKPDFFPALVAMVQTPIIGKYRRRLTPIEASRLQSFDENFKINNNNQIAYKQFGNSANVVIIKHILEELLKY